MAPPPTIDLQSQIDEVNKPGNIGHALTTEFINKRTTTGHPQGSQSLDRELAVTGVRQGFSIPEGNNLAERMANAPDLAADLQSRQDAALAAAQGHTAINSEQLLATAILQLAPILIGAAAGGTQGGAIGGQAGMVGGNILRQQLEKQNKAKQAASLAEAKSLGGQIKGLTDFTTKGILQGESQSFKAGESVLDRAGRLQAAGVSASGNKALGQGLTNLGKTMALQEDLRMVPVPPALREQLGGAEFAQRSTVNALLETAIETGKLEKEVDSAVADNIAQLDSAEELLTDLQGKWEVLNSGVGKGMAGQALGAISGGFSANVPFVATDSKLFFETARGLSRPIGKSIEKDRFSNEDAVFYEARLPDEFDTPKAGTSKIENVLRIVRSMNLAKKKAMIQSGRSAAQFISASPVPLTELKLRAAADTTLDGDLVAFIDENEVVRVVQVFKDDNNKITEIEPIDFMMSDLVGLGEGP